MTVTFINEKILCKALAGIRKEGDERCGRVGFGVPVFEGTGIMK